MRLRDQLLCVSTAYGCASGLRDSGVSKRIFGNGNRLKQLRDGGDAHSATIEDALQRLSDRWPEGAPWPDQVPRPTPVRSRAQPGAAPSPQAGMETGHDP